MLLHGSLSHRFKKVRSLLLIIIALSVVFYYSFVNEEYSLNQHLDETALPRVTTEKSKITNASSDTTEPELTQEELELQELSTPSGLKEKNKYFPLLQVEKEHSKIPDFTLPDDYFADQHSFKLRAKKKKLRYPVGHENYHKFPKLKKKADYPIIQSSYFSDGGLKVEEKLLRIKNAFKESWAPYKEHGYGHDEVLPLSHRSSDPFNGWSATIIDSLDTMILMDLKDDFKEAIQYIKRINFKQSLRDDIPIFENTIRILAGLVSGYELSNEKILLKSAKDFADLLIEAFDTPNNMPLLYYRWRDEIQNRFASKDACLAEVGSLSLEFSRLTQLTGDNRYFDAITRITKLFEKSFDNFYLPGLYSNRVDISGCDLAAIDGAPHSNFVKVIKDSAKFDHCIKQDEIKPSSKVQKYSLGALGDSFYEYLPKMYHLLRGHEKEAATYEKMYLRAIEQVRKYMLFSPKIPNGQNSLFLTSIEARREQDSIILNQDLGMQHLTCFAGGMFALGSRLFNISSDMEIAEKLTYGCVDMYEKFKIMPEQIKTDKMATPNDIYDEAARLKVFESTAPSQYSNGMNGGVVKESPFKSLVDDKVEEEEEMMIHGRARGIKSSPTSLQKRSISSTDVASIPKVVKFNNAVSLPPFRFLENGKRVWQVGKVHNQPIWINEMTPKYILRPEAIESVYYMYRITGDSKWRDYGWMMWGNIEKYCKTQNGEYAALIDVTNLGGENNFADSLESFWFAETLKYFYLLFEDITVWSLDEYVFNTEAHPFKLA